MPHPASRRIAGSKRVIWEILHQGAFASASRGCIFLLRVPQGDERALYSQSEIAHARVLAEHVTLDSAPQPTLTL